MDVGVDVVADVAPRLRWARLAGEPVTGIVLAGGRSQRMWRDKAWVELSGRPLVQWVLDGVKLVTNYQIVVARQAGRLVTLGVPVVVDRFAVRGPLTGIHAGLMAAETDLCLVVACDLPLVRTELLQMLLDRVGLAHAIVPYAGEEAQLPTLDPTAPGRAIGFQPLLAAYRKACITPLERLLRSGPLPSTALVSVLKAIILGPDLWRDVDPDGRSFFNVNTPEDVAHAARILTGPDPDQG